MHSRCNRKMIAIKTLCCSLRVASWVGHTAVLMECNNDALHDEWNVFTTHEWMNGVRARKWLIFIKVEVSNINPSSISVWILCLPPYTAHQTLSQFSIDCASRGEKQHASRILMPQHQRQESVVRRERYEKGFKEKRVESFNHFQPVFGYWCDK